MSRERAQQTRADLGGGPPAAAPSLNIRPARPGEFDEIYEVLRVAFGEAPDRATLEIHRPVFDPEMAFVAEDDGAIVGSLGGSWVELTLPGGPVRAAAVNWAGVLPTHRRRGALTGLMSTYLGKVRILGAPVALLHASEGGIYGRFGFGPATAFKGLRVDTGLASFRPETEASLRVRFVTEAEAKQTLPVIWDRARKVRHGQIERVRWLWGELFHEWKGESKGNGLFFVLAEGGGGDPEGYAVYHVAQDWSGHRARHTLHLLELTTATPAARRSLWRFMAELDLIGEVVTEALPPDESLEWMLTDQRAARTTQVVEGMYLRLLDVASALRARSYSGDGSLTIAVSDRFLPGAAGTFELTQRDGSVSCRPAPGQAAELALDTETLASLYLGGHSFHTLAEAGRIEEKVEGAIRKADALFLARPTAWSGTIF